MALLVPRVLLDEVHVVAAHDERAVHLGRVDRARQDPPADRDVAREGALFVDVGPLDRLLGRLEAEADGAVEAGAGLAGLGALLALALGEEVDAVLLLEGLLVLLIEFFFFLVFESEGVSNGGDDDGSLAFFARAFDTIEHASQRKVPRSASRRSSPKTREEISFDRTAGRRKVERGDRVQRRRGR